MSVRPVTAAVTSFADAASAAPAFALPEAPVDGQPVTEPEVQRAVELILHGQPQQIDWTTIGQPKYVLCYEIGDGRKLNIRVLDHDGNLVKTIPSNDLLEALAQEANRRSGLRQWA